MLILKMYISYFIIPFEQVYNGIYHIPIPKLLAKNMIYMHVIESPGSHFYFILRFNLPTLPLIYPLTSCYGVFYIFQGMYINKEIYHLTLLTMIVKCGLRIKIKL